MKFLITDYEFDKREIVEADKDYLALKEYIHKNSSNYFSISQVLRNSSRNSFELFL